MQESWWCVYVYARVCVCVCVCGGGGFLCLPCSLLCYLTGIPFCKAPFKKAGALVLQHVLPSFMSVESTFFLPWQHQHCLPGSLTVAHVVAVKALHVE